MKPLLISLFVILQMIAMPLSAADAQTTQYRHPATGLIFPDSVEGIIRGNVKDFEGTNPGLGVSVPYDRPGITVTVYIYTFGFKSIPNDLSSPILKTTLPRSCRTSMKWKNADITSL